MGKRTEWVYTKWGGALGLAGRRLYAVLILLALALMLGACGGGGGSSTPVEEPTEQEPADNTNPPAASTSVTFNGTVEGTGSAALNLARGLSGPANALAEPTQFTLRCVTFEADPEAANGPFAANGTFSLTLEDAEGVAMGCFVTDSDLVPVATVFFITGTSGSLDRGEEKSVALDAGEYDIVLEFNPNQGRATVDLSGEASNLVETEPADLDDTVDPALLAGAWAITCDTLAGSELTACEDVWGTGTSTDFYLNPIKAEAGSDEGFAVGLWLDRDTFIAAGATEGIDAADFPGVTLSSLNSDAPGAAATGSFNGFTGESGFGWDPDYGDAGSFVMTGSDVLNALANQSIAYDSSRTFGTLTGGACPGSLVPADLTDPDYRYCLVGFLWTVHDDPIILDELLVGDVANSAFESFVYPLDSNGDPIAVNATDDIPFRFVSLGVDPQTACAGSADGIGVGRGSRSGHRVRFWRLLQG